MNCATTDENKKFLESIYHERQRSAFCATHAFNNLFQSNLFTEFDFAAIAEQLDKQERELFSSEEDFTKVRGNNVDSQGNFSIQVLSNALEGQGVTLTHIMKPEALFFRQNPTEAQAFLCNHAAHWLTLRKFGSHWMNLDSTLKSPEYISPTFLSMFIEQLIQEGYSVFVLQGSFPQCEADELALIFDPTMCVPIHKPTTNTVDLDPEMQLALALSKQDRGGGGVESEEEMLRRAMEMSLKASGSQGHIPESQNELMGDVDDDEDLRKAIELSMQQSGEASTTTTTNTAPQPADDDEDEELKQALAMSLNQS